MARVVRSNRDHANKFITGEGVILGGGLSPSIPELGGFEAPCPPYFHPLHEFNLLDIVV